MQIQSDPGSISGSRTKQILRVCSACLIACIVLFELQRLLNYPALNQVYNQLIIPERILVCLVLFILPWKENRWMSLFAAGLLLLALTSLIRGVDVLVNTKRFINRGVLVYLLCPAVAVLIPPSGHKSFLRSFIGIWTAFMTVISVLAVFALFNNTTIPDLAGERFIGIYKGRLAVFMYATITAANLTLSIMMCLIEINLYQQKWVRLLSFLKILPMFFCLSLANGRASYFSAGIGIGLAVLCVLYPIIIQKMWKKCLRYATCFMIVTVVAALSIFVNYQIIRLYNAMTVTNQSGRIIISDARAEQDASPANNTVSPAQKTKETQETKETKKTKDSKETSETTDTKKTTEKTSTKTSNTIRERRLINNNTLTNRDQIWKAAWETIKASPEILLFGTSAPNLMEYFNQHSPRPGFYYHMHNILLQILMETGLVGLFLSVVFLVWIVRGSWRLLRNQAIPLWQRMIFLPAVTGLMMEGFDCLLWLGWSTQHQVIVFLFSGFTLALSNRKTDDKPDQLTAEAS